MYRTPTTKEVHERLDTVIRFVKEQMKKSIGLAAKVEKVVKESEHPLTDRASD